MIKKEQKLLSFIVPVYNVEKYLKECLDSIVKQIDDNCEIILVDDGSPDSSPKICDEYSSLYKNVKVIHQENKGLSGARNTGLNISDAEYVLFVDSDDRISPGSVDKILDWIKNTSVDLCFLQAVKFYENNVYGDSLGDLSSKYLFGKSKVQAIEYISSLSKYPGSACAKIYKTKFLKENNIYFPKDRRYSEDLGFIRDCILHANSFDSLEIPFYEYRQNREGSITNQVKMKNFEDLNLFIEESIDLLTKNKKEKDLIAKFAMRFVAYEYMILLRLYNFIPNKDKSKALYILKRNRWVLKYASGYKSKITQICSNVFGLKLTAKMLLMYENIFLKR